MTTRIVLDRSRTEAAAAIGLTWFAFMIALPVFEPEAAPSLEMVAWSLGVLGLIIAGFAAASRVRPMSRRETSERARLLFWSLSLGALMAIVNLSANLGLASLDPALHRLLVERFASLSPWKSALAAPVIEEVLFRLFFLSLVAIVIARFVEDRNKVFWTALAVSALVFGVMHVLRPEPVSIELAWIYRSGVTLKSAAGGLLLGWVFWRWGLAYSAVCHSAINGIHLLLEPLVFGS